MKMSWRKLKVLFGPPVWAAKDAVKDVGIAIGGIILTPLTALFGGIIKLGSALARSSLDIVREGWETYCDSVGGIFSERAVEYGVGSPADWEKMTEEQKEYHALLAEVRQLHLFVTHSEDFDSIKELKEKKSQEEINQALKEMSDSFLRILVEEYGEEGAD